MACCNGVQAWLTSPVPCVACTVVHYARHDVTSITVMLADGTCLIANFSPYEPVGSVVEFLKAECLDAAVAEAAGVRLLAW